MNSVTTLPNQLRAKYTLLAQGGTELGGLINKIIATKNRLDTEYPSGGALQLDLAAELPGYVALNRAGTAFPSSKAIEQASRPLGNYAGMVEWMDSLKPPVWTSEAQDPNVSYDTDAQALARIAQMQFLYDCWKTATTKWSAA